MTSGIRRIFASADTTLLASLLSRHRTMTMTKRCIWSYLLTMMAALALCAVPVATALNGAEQAKVLFYSTGNDAGPPNGAELFSIEVSGSKITTTDIGPTKGGDCISLALSPSGTLYSMCGPLFGAQQLATIDPKTGLANLFGVAVPGLSVMAIGFAPDGTLYAVGDCNPDANFECHSSSSPPDPNYNSLYTINEA